jgi:hypothetical protein
MHDRCLLWSVAVGVVVAMIQAGISYWRWGVRPELQVVIEILLSSLAVAIAIKVTLLAWRLKGAAAVPISDEEKLYFCLGALALPWVSIAAVIRKFSPPRR